MSHTFKYPNTTAPTTTLTFTTAWLLEDEKFYRRNGEIINTLGGPLLSKSYGDNQLVVPFTVRVPRSSGSATDWIDVLNFINSVVNFATETFYWTDESSNVYAVRMENEDTRPSASYVNYVDYQFILRVVS